jgi:hypothetical protein
MNSQKVSFVESVSDSDVVVVCRNPATENQLKVMGGKQTLLPPRKWKIPYASEEQLASVLSTLRDAQIAMAGSLEGWPPSAVFQQLRDNGKLAGKFTEIMWSKPEKDVLAER